MSSGTTALRGPRIALGDTLIVVALVSLAMASLRFTWRDLGSGWYLRHWAYGAHGPPHPLEFLELPYNRALVNGLPLLVLAALAVICFVVRRTKFGCKELARQPGLIFCLTIVSVAVVTFLRKPAPQEFLEIPDTRVQIYRTFVLVWALYAMVCLIIPPAWRPRLRFVRESTLVSCLIIAIVIYATSVATPVHGELWQAWRLIGWRIIVFGLVTNVSYAVLCLLLVLKLSGRYGPTQSSGDSLGRILPWVWITVLILERFRSYLEWVQIV